MVKTSNNKSSDRKYYLFALKIMRDFGASIAVPVIIFVLMGQYLDEKYAKTPLYTIIGFIIAALISIKIIRKKSKCYGNEYQTLIDNDLAKKDK